MIKTGTNEQIGITSWGIGCNRPFLPGVYTNLGLYTNWIESEIESASFVTTTATPTTSTSTGDDSESVDGSDSDDSSDDLLFSAKINDDNGDDEGLDGLIDDIVAQDENGYDVVISFENSTYYTIWAISGFFIVFNLICYAFYRTKSRETMVRLN